MVEIVLFALAVGLLVPIAALFAECCAAVWLNRSRIETQNLPKPRVAILVPAHNEAQEIGSTLSALLPQVAAADRLVVIADNCTDETAEVARNSGAIAIERQDLDRRGKGYALDYGLRFLEADPPDIVVIVDADCHIQPGTIDRIARIAFESGRPVQATYLMERPPTPTPRDSISALAFLVKNLVRPSGLAQLGLPCLLTGTGMAFPWSVIATAPLASGNIVEDMQVAVDLAVAGYPPMFCADAHAIGRLPQQQQAAKSQRTRWEHGHLQTLLTQTPRLFKAAIEQKRWDLVAIALDLCVPPLSLLVAMWVAIMGAAFLAGTLGFSWNPATFLALEGLLIFIAIVGAWAKFGRTQIPLLTLLAVPFYILWKIPLYLAFLVKPQTKWVRTERDAAKVPPA